MSRLSPSSSFPTSASATSSTAPSSFRNGGTASPNHTNGGEQEEEEPEEGIDGFQESVRRFYIALAELQTLDNDDALSNVYDELAAMRAEIYVASGEAPQEVEEEMLADCERKAGEALLNRLRKATSAISPDPIAAPMLFYECARLKQEAKAANIYGGFIQRQLTEATEEALKDLGLVRSLRRLQLGSTQDLEAEDTGQDSQPHVIGLNRVLGEASRAIESLRPDREHGPSFASEACLSKIQKALHEIAVKQAVKVLQWYKEDCGVRKWQERCLDRSEHIVIQELDFALDELHYILGICNRYLAFIGGSREDVMDLYIQVQDLMGCYVSMEDAYCAINVAKAIKMGQPTEVKDGVFISTIVEDVPMILNRSIERATQTLSDQAIMAVANRATELLSPESIPSFAGALQQLLQDDSLQTPREEGGAIDQFSRALERSLDEEEGDVCHEAMIYAVNSMDCAVSAMRKMRDMLMDLGARGHQGGPYMVQAVAQELGRIVKQYEADCKSLLDDFVSRYTSSGILTYAAEVLGKISYNIDSTTYEKEAAARTDPFVLKFLDYMFVKDKVLQDCQDKMTDTALVVFIEGVVKQLSPALVKVLKGKRFTEWGGMKLRQQVRLLQEKLVELIDGKGTLLLQFAVLDHMVTLLNLESPGDFQYCKAGAKEAGLTEKEVKDFMKLRVEFDPTLIDRLKVL